MRSIVEFVSFSTLPGPGARLLAKIGLSLGARKVAKKPVRLRGKNVAKAGPASNGGHPLRNTILLNLPRSEYELVFPKLQYIELPTQTVLNEMGEPIEFAWFVNGGLGSILNVMSTGKSVEVGLSGHEGFVGIPLIAGLRTSPTRIVMQVAGSGYKISAKVFADVLSRCPQLAKSLQRYAQELVLQATHVAACNRLHEVEQRLARWLLMSQDRLGGDIVPLTQQFLAHMLGTRRASVTVAAGILQDAGFIAYSRGKVKIKNRRKLEKASCECYAIIKQQSRRWQNEAR
jgi:CRP-like cAMP-binding protein